MAGSVSALSETRCRPAAFARVGVSDRSHIVNPGRAVPHAGAWAGVSTRTCVLAARCTTGGLRPERAIAGKVETQAPQFIPAKKPGTSPMLRDFGPPSEEQDHARIGLFFRGCWRSVSPASGRARNPTRTHLGRVERCRISPGYSVPRPIFLIQLPGLADPGRRAGDTTRPLILSGAARLLSLQSFLKTRDPNSDQAFQGGDAVRVATVLHAEQPRMESFRGSGQVVQELGNVVHRSP